MAACTPDSDHVRNRDLAGRLFETAVANALRRIAIGRGGDLRYWRDDDGEADFIVELGSGITLVEVTSSADAKGKVAKLKRVAHKVGARRQVVACDALAVSRVGDVNIVPMGRFLLEPKEFLA